MEDQQQTLKLDMLFDSLTGALEALREQPSNTGTAWTQTQAQQRATAKRKLRKAIKHIEAVQ